MGVAALKRALMNQDRIFEAYNDTHKVMGPAQPADARKEGSNL